MDPAPRAWVREICLGLPETFEVEAWGDPTWRVRNKIFAMEKRGDKRISIWCKADPGAQEVLTSAEPELYFVPPYVGPKGWIGIRIDRRPNQAEVAHHIRASYRLVAPKRLARLLPDEGLRDRSGA